MKKLPQLLPTTQHPKGLLNSSIPFAVQAKAVYNSTVFYKRTNLATELSPYTGDQHDTVIHLIPGRGVLWVVTDSTTLVI